MSTSLQIDGRLTFPLYHATSSLFYDSIVEHGLGGKNPIEELKVLQALRQLLVYEKEHPLKVELWFYLEEMAQQQITAGSNWQHGQAYLTSSKRNARQHARNKYGSELISETLKLYTTLGCPKEFGSDEYPVLKLVAQTASPLYVTISAVPLECLSGEKGEPINEVISLHERVNESTKKEQGEEFQAAWWLELCPIKFRLLSPVKIQPEQISTTLC